MKIEEILKQSEDKSLEFKKEIPKNRQNLLKTVVALNRLRQLEEKGLIYKQGSGPRVRYSV
jgi:DNA-binding HxlR family transcriptional regulator